MLVGLYTSRVILQSLGVVDYGIYNVVGSVLGLFSFVSLSLGQASVRFISYGLGKGEPEKLKEIFSTCVTCHFSIAMLVLLVGEAFALFFLSDFLNIPDNRRIAAGIVYQFSLFSAVLTIMISPYRSAIISHEDMSAFAYLSLIDVLLKLLTAWSLLLFTSDRLIIYSILMFLIFFIDRVFFQTYAKKRYQECKFKITLNRSLLKEMGVFIGLNTLTELANVTYQQGLSILLNIFFGPVVNAARGIAMQVDVYVNSFVSNFQTAFLPQVNKNYAANNDERTMQIVNSGSRFSVYMLTILIIPVILETPEILRFWLGEVPDYTCAFVQVMLLITLAKTIIGPLDILVKASGKIKQYQIANSLTYLLILPSAYIFVKYLSYPPVCVFMIQLFFTLMVLLISLYVCTNQGLLSFWSYSASAIAKPLAISAFAFGLSYLIKQSIGIQIHFVISVIISMTITMAIIYLLGINKNERAMVNNIIAKKLKR